MCTCNLRFQKKFCWKEAHIYNTSASLCFPYDCFGMHKLKRPTGTSDQDLLLNDQIFLSENRIAGDRELLSNINFLYFINWLCLKLLFFKMLNPNFSAFSPETCLLQFYTHFLALLWNEELKHCYLSTDHAVALRSDCFSLRHMFIF